MSYGAKIDYHGQALVELFKQLQQDRNIPIDKIKITQFAGEDWKDFILQSIQKNGGTEKIFGNEKRPFSNNELRLLLCEKTFDNMFENLLKEHNLWFDLNKNMETKTNKSANNFIKNEVLKMENRMFWGSIISSSIGYLVVTLWLNNIRATASLWFVWVLIIIQFALYFSIFISSYNRSKILGINNNIALILFIVLAILGRVNDWEVIIVPIVVIVMLAFSARNKKASQKGKLISPENKI